MSDTRLIKQLQLVEEPGGAIVANAITDNHKHVHLFSFYPDWVDIKESDLVGRSVGWARDLFYHKMAHRPPSA